MEQTGPCPICGTILTTPVSAVQKPAAPVVKRLPEPPKSAGRSSSRRKGVVLADSCIDLKDQERRELGLIFRVVALIVLVICVCVAVLLYLKQWMMQ